MKNKLFFERRSFVVLSSDLTKFMKEKKNDNTLRLEITEDTNEILFYSSKSSIEYNEDDIIEAVSDELGVDINNLFIDGDKYCAAIYFTERKLETD